MRSINKSEIKKALLKAVDFFCEELVRTLNEPEFAYAGLLSACRAEAIKKWKEAYGRDFVDEEAKKAEGWIASNPGRAPKSDFTRFFNGWLNRAHEARRKASPPGTTRERHYSTPEETLASLSELPERDPASKEKARALIDSMLEKNRGGDGDGSKGSVP